jgi:hypothetical protein
MEKKTIITTPYPTLEETAKKLGVPLWRARELKDLVVKHMAAERGAAKNGGKKSLKARV